MTYKQIEASREIRMWIVQIIVPAATLAATMAAIPEVRNAVSRKVYDVRQSFKRKIRR